MKSFNFNTTKLIVSFECPVCKKTISEDVSAYIPEPDMGANTAEKSERNQSVDIECDICGAKFTIEVYKNMNEGNVEVYYHGPQGEQVINAIRIQASY